jgi:glutamate synthase (NADPH/NADH) large chain
MTATTSSSCPTAGRPDRIAIPALLATAAVHHHLIRKGLRTSVGLVVETGEAARSASFRHLAGYGAEAINPYLAFDTCSTCMPKAISRREVDRDEVVKRYIKAIGKGILKVMSKMGISTYQSYCGAQIFDAVGLSSRVRRHVLHRHGDDDRGRRPEKSPRDRGPPPLAFR